jgi:hypothetical protein
MKLPQQKAGQKLEQHLSILSLLLAGGFLPHRMVVFLAGFAVAMTWASRPRARTVFVLFVVHGFSFLGLLIIGH